MSEKLKERAAKPESNPASYQSIGMPKTRVRIGDFEAEGDPSLVRYAANAHIESTLGIDTKSDWICSTCNARNDYERRRCWACSFRSAFHDGPLATMDMEDWPKKIVPNYVLLLALQMAERETRNDTLKPLYRRLKEHIRGLLDESA